MSSSSPVIRIGVVGAGVSALNAACQILETVSDPQTIKLSIFEATGLAGGRVRSVPIPNDPENWVNLGANWVHGIENNPLYTILAEEEKTRTAKSIDGLYIPSKSNLVFNSKGERISSDVVQQTYEMLEKLYLEVEDGLKTPPEEAPAEEDELKQKDVGFGTLLEEKVLAKLGKEIVEKENPSEAAQIYQSSDQEFRHTTDLT